jgi:hypothetical protein
MNPNKKIGPVSTIVAEEGSEGREKKISTIDVAHACMKGKKKKMNKQKTRGKQK